MCMQGGKIRTGFDLAVDYVYLDLQLVAQWTMLSDTYNFLFHWLTFSYFTTVLKQLKQLINIMLVGTDIRVPVFFAWQFKEDTQLSDVATT